MSSKYTAEKTTASILSVLSGYELSNEDKQQIKNIVCASLTNAVEITTDQHIRTAVNCCGPEADLAHQIRHEVNLKKSSLIANLLGPR